MAGDVHSLVDAQIHAYKRSTIRTLWIVTGILLLAFGGIGAAALLLIPPSTLTQLQQGLTPAGAGEADFLRLFVPVLAVVFGLVLGLLGLKRLEQFDGEINNLRQHLSTQLFDERKISTEDRGRFREEVGQRLTEVIGMVASIADKAVLDAFQSRVSEAQADIAKEVEGGRALVNIIRKELKPYEWLSERKDSIDQFIGIHTVGVAHDRVSELMANSKVDSALAVAQRAIDDRLPGNGDDFHNLAAELAIQGQTPMAIQVIDNGLELYPEDVDLLSDGIKHNTSMARLTDARAFYSRLREIPFEHWNWRAFAFSGDYLEVQGTQDEIDAVYAEFRKQIPDDERGYSQPGIYYYQLGRINQAITILTQGMDACRNCAQCAMMLSKALTEVGRYADAVAAADRAIEAGAAEQPSANLSATVWHRAIAVDRLVHQEMQQTQRPVEPEPLRRLVTLARECVIDYRTALLLPDALPSFRRRGPNRLQILHGSLAKLGIPVESLEEVFAPVRSLTEPGHEVGTLMSQLMKQREQLAAATRE